MADVSPSNGGRRLTSWKEIAAFFGKDERTVKRWEVQRGLPVRRVPGGARTTVFAYADELERWLTGAAIQTLSEPPTPKQAGTGPAVEASPAVRARTRWRPIAIGALVAALGVAGGALWLPWATETHAERSSSVHVPPPPARELYYSGVFQLGLRTESGFNRAIADFNAAIAADPDYAAPYAGLASAYNLLSQYTLVPPQESYPKAKAAAERAIALDDKLADGYAALGFNEFYWGRNFSRSSELFEKAVTLAPNAPQILHWYAITSMHLGQLKRALDLISHAQELDPDARPIVANKALILFYGGNTEEALRLLESLRQEHPDYLATPSYLATIYLALGRYPEFLDSYETAARVERNDARIAIAGAARKGLQDSGGPGMLRAMLDAQLAAFASGREHAYKVAATAALFRRPDQALAYLQTAIDKGETDVLGLRLDPAFTSLHADPRFAALIQRVGLPPLD